MVLDNTGAKSQLAPLTGSIIIIIVIIWLGPFFEPLPKACLASIIVVALKGLLLQSKDLISLWKINKYESICWIGTFLGVVLLDVDIGLFIGVALSIFLIIVRDQSAKIIQLDKYDSSFIDKKFLNETVNITNGNANIKILKIQNSLYFVNISSFISEFHKLTGSKPNLASKTKSENYSIIQSDILNATQANVSYYLLDFSAVNYIDSSALKAILQVSLQ